ncbi:MAG: tRNA (adenosine(37)-N6)-threonylcarbamoyltransferase complex ATPase subunit type 1 TsaE [Clostridia bacterium]|nr:tRNA (adenosine(37)-N6)-threonylcarbamoyltransferase complex ATPase subunit type 1 TsaE [Clostridia bacterium]
MVELISYSEEETKRLAKKVAEKLKKGNIVVLTGDLGSGKTKFTEGILTYFDLQEEISSPTFTIVNEYKKNEVNIFHFDVYRLADVDEFLAIGGEEYFEKGICIIEWGEIIEEILPKDAIKIEFLKDEKNENIRKIKIKNFNI